MCQLHKLFPLASPAAGLVIFSFLVVEPSDVGFAPQSGSVMGSIVSAVLHSTWA
jgi:hypothetical protein